MNKIDLVFPCAGTGERFGTVFKPFLKIGDLTFIEKAYEPFQKWSHLINNIYIIVTREQEKAHSVARKIDHLFPNKKANLLILDKKTSGPVQTVIEGYIKSRENNGPFIVCDCDHSINVDQLFKEANKKYNPDIIIPTWDISPAIQKNWSKILLNGQSIVRFVNKEPVDFELNTIKGIIGCIYFKNNALVRDAPPEYENFYEIIRDHFNQGKRVELISVTNAYFFGSPKMLEDCIEKRRNECTIFCDIDGVLIRHKNHSTSESKDNEFLSGISTLRKLSKQNHRVILTTARSKKFKPSLESLLTENKVPYDEIVMGLPSGPRILINDRKPKKPFSRQSNSFEVFRNEGLSSLSLDKIIEANSYRIIRDLSANSFAKTYLVDFNGKKFVRKWIPKSAGYKHCETLKRQCRDVKRLNFLSPRTAPEIYAEEENEIEYFYDMEYLSNYEELSACSSEEKLEAITMILSELSKEVYSLSKPVNGRLWLKDFLNEKIYPKFNDFSLQDRAFDVIINSEDILVNGRYYQGLRKVLGSILEEAIFPQEISVIHGDLTLENILYNSKTKDIKLIDMDGSRLFDAKELDLGKMSQSILSRYDEWKDLQNHELIYEIDTETKRFKTNGDFYSNDSEEVTKLLIEPWQEVLNETSDVVLKKAYFYMSMYFIRFLPFRLQLGKEHGVHALLMATVWLNKLLGDKDEY